MSSSISPDNQKHSATDQVGMEISLKRCATAAAHVAKEWPPSDAPPAESPAV